MENLHRAGRQVKRSPLARKTPLKRSEMKRGRCTLARSPIAKVNKARAAKLRLRDFGPHGEIIIPTLPCAVRCKGWWAGVSDETLSLMMQRALDEPKRYAHISVPAHVAKSRGAGGQASAIVPLSWDLHSEQHTAGIVSFQAKYEVDLISLAARLWRLSPARNLTEDV